MNWPLFVTTFCLVFFAELGDKTQLAIMGQAAASSCKWTVFWAALLALAASTAFGVAAGHLVRRFVPNDSWIKGAGGILFLLFGIAMLGEAFRGIRSRACALTHRPPPLPAESPDALSGWDGLFIVRQAEIVERAAMIDYQRLADASFDPAEKAAFLRICRERKWHGEAMLCALACGSDRDIPFTEEMARRLPPRQTLIARALGGEDGLGESIRRERRIARFYGVLSQTVRNRRLRDTFLALRFDGIKNARRLENLRRRKAPPAPPRADEPGPAFFRQD